MTSRTFTAIGEWRCSLGPFWRRDNGVALGDTLTLEEEGPQRAAVDDDIAEALDALPTWSASSKPVRKRADDSLDQDRFRAGIPSATVGSVTALWRYPVKSMGGEELQSSTLDLRAFHGDRMWAVRDLELSAITTARRLPALLGCTARFVEEPPAGVGPGDLADVTDTVPDGTEITSSDRERLDARLSELVGKRVALVPLPALNDKAGYRGVLWSKRDIRSQWALDDDEPLPDFSMFPIRKLLQLSIYATPIGNFADAYAVHVLTTSSLRTMGAIGGDFNVRRFRPTVVVDTAGDGLVEQEWIGGTLRAGDMSLGVEIPGVQLAADARTTRAARRP